MFFFLFFKDYIVIWYHKNAQLFFFFSWAAFESSPSRTMSENKGLINNGSHWGIIFLMIPWQCDSAPSTQCLTSQYKWEVGKYTENILGLHPCSQRPLYSSKLAHYLLKWLFYYQLLASLTWLPLLICPRLCLTTEPLQASMERTRTSEEGCSLVTMFIFSWFWLSSSDLEHQEFSSLMLG